MFLLDGLEEKKRNWNAQAVRFFETIEGRRELKEIIEIKSSFIDPLQK